MFSKIQIIRFITSLLLFASCDKNESVKDSQLFELLPSSKTNITFNNKIEDQEKFNILTYRNYYNGGGVAIGDINNDGLEDLFFNSNMGDNQLYLNKGELKFENISMKAGIIGKGYWSTGVTMADVNADGFLDIYVCNSGDLKGENRKNELFINNGDLTFSDKADEYGLADDGYSTHASFFDMDADGDLDCFVLNNSYSDPQKINQFASRARDNYGAPGGDRLYKNENGKFIDVTKDAGIFSGDIDFGLGVSISDINNDLLPDIYISNDFWERDYLYINQGGGKFKEELTERICYTSANSMGSDIADLNNDGYAEIYTTDMLPASNKRLKSAIKLEEYTLEDIKWRNSYYFQFIQNSLHLNNGDGSFNEISHFSGVSATDWSWGALIADFDNDSQKDIFVSNGIYHDITDLDFIDFLGDKKNVEKIMNKNNPEDFRPFANAIPHNPQRNYLFMNQGNMKFKNKAKELGFNDESYSNGSAYGDLDNDGDLELVINNVNSEAFIFKNNAKSNYLKIKLEGGDKNKNGIGAIIKIYHDTTCQTAQVYASRGFQSSVSNKIIFGLSKSFKIDSLQIIWPNQKMQTINDNIKINTTITLKSSEAHQQWMKPIAETKLAFGKNEIAFKTPYIHKENKYHDFDHERLMPHGLSTASPRMLKGDIDGDGDEDFIILGAKGQGIEVYINEKGKFILKPSADLSSETSTDKVCGAFIDIDQDNDRDLIVGMGGNEYLNKSISFVSKFFTNDGKGNFTLDLLGPNFTGNLGCIKPADFDNDGDVDLFVGGKVVPGAFGLTPRSWMMRNDGDIWTDITDEGTGPIGMVSDATWVDLNKDGFLDLIVVGEWMPITYFMNNKGNDFLQKMTIPDTEGWWNCISKSDLDGDGDLDLVAGNWGENFKLKASKEKPLMLYTTDFDGNNKTENILEWYPPEDKKPYPFASKFDLFGQMPKFKKSNLKYAEYANKQVNDLFSPELLKKAQKNICRILSSCIIWNDNGKLSIETLPDEAQMSPVFALTIEDFDKDGIKDIFLGGNFYKVKPEIGRLDGFNGGYFKGSKNRKYNFVSNINSGLSYKGEVRDAIVIENKLIISRNNDTLLTFEFNN